MSTTVTLYADKSAVLDEYSDANDHSSAAPVLSPGYKLLIHFFGFPSNKVFKQLLSATLGLYGCSTAASDQLGVIYTADALGSPWDQATAQWPCAEPITFDGAAFRFYPTAAYGTASLKLRNIYNVAHYGVVVDYTAGRYLASIQTSRGSNKPYISLTLSDDDTYMYAENLSPASGYFPNELANTFSWTINQYGYSYTAPTYGVRLQYRANEQSGLTEIALGDVQSYTMPAGTITTNSFQWRLKVTSNNTTIQYTNWHTLSTVETTPIATAVAPNGTMEDGSKPITLRWSHNISTGTAQTKADVKYTYDGTNWTQVTMQGDVDHYEVPASTFTSGERRWHVRTYNTDNVASAWSPAGVFRVVSSPTAPGIIIQDTTPRPAIRWSTSEQDAYQLILDAGLPETHYGTDKFWRSPNYLPDGTHTVRLRVQNSYGLWSAWSEASIPVTHVTQPAVQLSVLTDYRAVLSWAQGSYNYFIVYRNGVAIAKTTALSYIDEYSAGPTAYYVRGCFTGSNGYGISAVVTVDIRPDVVMISRLGSREWLRLPYSDSPHNTVRRTRSSDVQLSHMAGRVYPIGERSESRDYSMRVTCAIREAADKASLEELVGAEVCLKSCDGQMVVGILSEMSITQGIFFSVYDFAVRQIDWEEAIDLDA